jgi:magnesium-transporting ATPase (P-type)
VELPYFQFSTEPADSGKRKWELLLRRQRGVQSTGHYWREKGKWVWVSASVNFTWDILYYFIEGKSILLGRAKYLSECQFLIRINPIFISQKHTYLAHFMVIFTLFHIFLLWFPLFSFPFPFTYLAHFMLIFTLFHIFLLWFPHFPPPPFSPSPFSIFSPKWGIF